MYVVASRCIKCGYKQVDPQGYELRNMRDADDDAMAVVDFGVGIKKIK